MTTFQATNSLKFIEDKAVQEPYKVHESIHSFNSISDQLINPSLASTLVPTDQLLGTMQSTRPALLHNFEFHQQQVHAETARVTFFDELDDRYLFKSSQAVLRKNNHLNSAKPLAPVGVNVDPEFVTSGIQTKHYDRLPQRIHDPGLRSVIKSGLSDGLLDRRDMIAVFKKAEDENEVSKTELRDLKNLVRHASSLKMPDDIRRLSSKVVNGNFANRNYQGELLGDLFAGTSAEHLSKLVDKWFFGGDRPVAKSVSGNTTYAYRLANQPLFQNGIRYQDVRQGQTGDCYFLASLASVARHQPHKIRNMFIDNGDNTYTVRFYNRSGKADYVTVDNYLPAFSWGRPAYADYSKELWVALAEKAYAQLNESGWIGRSKSGHDFRPEDNDTNSYQGIYGGFPDEATEQITGQQMGRNWIKNTTPGAIARAFKAGQFISFASKRSTSKVVPNHAYTLVNYNPAIQKFTLYNPWGFDGIRNQQDTNWSNGKVTFSWQEIRKNFSSWYRNL